MMQVVTADDLALIERKAIFFDDEVGTIEPHIRAAERYGVVPFVVRDVAELFELMKLYREQAIFFLDMHIPQVSDLGEIHCGDLETNNGSAFATAMYLAFLRKTSSDIRFANILSGRPIDSSAEQILSELEDDDFIVEEIDKSDQEKFENQLSNYSKIVSAEGNTETKVGAEMKSRDVDEVDVLEEILRELTDAPVALVSAALGAIAETEQALEEVKSTARQYLQQGSSDVRMRIDFVLYMKSALSSILGTDNVEDQKAWMAAKNDFLGGKAPLDLIESRDINDLAMVVAALDRVMS